MSGSPKDMARAQAIARAGRAGGMGDRYNPCPHCHRRHYPCTTTPVGNVHSTKIVTRSKRHNRKRTRVVR